jgi:hypothetical protein
MLAINDSTNDLDLTCVPKIEKLKLGVKKPGKSDTKSSNPCGNPTIHFASCIKCPSAENSSCNCKKKEPHLMQDLLYAYQGKHK